METSAGSGSNAEVIQSSPVPEDFDDDLFEIVKDKTFIKRAKAMWEEDVRLSSDTILCPVLPQGAGSEVLCLQKQGEVCQSFGKSLSTSGLDYAPDEP